MLFIFILVPCSNVVVLLAEHTSSFGFLLYLITFSNTIPQPVWKIIFFPINWNFLFCYLRPINLYGIDYSYLYLFLDPSVCINFYTSYIFNLSCSILLLIYPHTIYFPYYFRFHQLRDIVSDLIWWFSHFYFVHQMVMVSYFFAVASTFFFLLL